MDSCSSVTTTTTGLMMEESGIVDQVTQVASATSCESVVADPAITPFATSSATPAPQLILPALIETTEPPGESAIPNIPKKGEQQLLSFPNVSSVQEDEVIQINPSTNSNTISVPTEVLRTPPRPLIEDKAAATEENIAPVAPPPVIPPPVVPVAPNEGTEDVPPDLLNGDDGDAQSVEAEARIKREKLEVVDPCSANGDADRLDLKIEKMKQDDKSPLPGHASDHRVINYHSRPFLYPVRSVHPPNRGFERRGSSCNSLVSNIDPLLHSPHMRPMSPNHHSQQHLQSSIDCRSPDSDEAALNLARSSYDGPASTSIGPVLYDSLSPYHPQLHPSLHHNRSPMYRGSPFHAHIPVSHPNSHYLMTPYHQRPIQTPTSIPVSVVTSGSEHLRKMNANNHSTGMVMNQVDRNIIMNAPVYRNNTAGRRTTPNSVISTGTRTTSRQGVPQHVSPSSLPLHQHPAHNQQPHHQPDTLSSNMSLTVSSSSNNGVNGSSLSSSMKPPPIPSGNPSKPFKCPICSKNLASKNVYQLHLRSHNGEKPFGCNLCGNAFSQKTSLTRHMRSHTGERPFSCQVCAKRFADKERIKIHMRTHTGEKPFSCSICHKQFSQKSTVKRHMSVHTGEKPFKCRHCSKGFANRGNLVAHEKTHSSPPSLLPSSSTHPLTRPSL